jgi:hypothetical protein
LEFRFSVLRHTGSVTDPQLLMTAAGPTKSSTPLPENPAVGSKDHPASGHLLPTWYCFATKKGMNLRPFSHYLLAVNGKGQGGDQIFPSRKNQQDFSQTPSELQFIRSETSAGT